MLLQKDLSQNCFNAKKASVFTHPKITYLLLLCGCLVQNGAETVQPSNGANIKYIANVNRNVHIVDIKSRLLFVKYI